MNKKLEALISLGIVSAMCVGGYVSNRNRKPIIEKDKDFEIRYVDESFCKDPYIRCNVIGESGSFVDYLEHGGSKTNLEYNICLKRSDNGELCTLYVIGSLGERKELSDVIKEGTRIAIHKDNFTANGLFNSTKNSGYIAPAGLNIVR